MKRVPETEIGAAVVAWLEADGWDVWQEVQPGAHGGAVCDIVARRGPVVHAVECKAVMSIGVLEQAEHWLNRAHFVSVAVPPSKGRSMYERLAVLAGIGVVWVDQRTMWERHEQRTLQQVDRWAQAPMRRTVQHRYARPLAEFLTEQRRHWPATAGNNYSERYTPFRDTCGQLLAVVQATPGITMRAAVAAIKAHHYRTDKAAMGSLMQWVQARKVPGVEARKVDGSRELQLFPTMTTRDASLNESAASNWIGR